MRRLFLTAILILTLTGFILPGAVSAQACPTGFITTTLGAEGVPNLFRLGLKYGVSWTRIILPNGALPVPEHIFADTVVCVPTGGATTIVIIINNPPAPVTTPVPNVPPPAPPAPFDPVASYCAGVPEHGTPDRGSCLLEAQSIVFGKQRIVQTGVVCAPQELSRQTNGTFRQCSIFGDKWLSASTPTDNTIEHKISTLLYNGVGTSFWGQSWGFVTFSCVKTGLKGFATRLDGFTPTGVLPANVAFVESVFAVPGWDQVQARVEAQRRGLTEFEPASCP